MLKTCIKNAIKDLSRAMKDRSKRYSKELLAKQKKEAKAQQDRSAEDQLNAQVVAASMASSATSDSVPTDPAIFKLPVGNHAPIHIFGTEGEFSAALLAGGVDMAQPFAVAKSEKVMGMAATEPLQTTFKSFAAQFPGTAECMANGSVASPLQQGSGESKVAAPVLAGFVPPTALQLQPGQDASAAFAGICSQTMLVGYTNAMKSVSVEPGSTGC
eukprot:10938332-Lingulodinium_polyedra.AAC.1